MSTIPARLVLFDGVCAVCDAGMSWLLDHDPDGRFHYAPLQGDTSAAIRARHPELPEQLDSIIYVEQTERGETVSWHTDAVLRIARDLGWPWRAFTFFRILPAPLRDLGYRAFAAIRYRVFGKIEMCRMPKDGEESRFLP